MSNAWATFVACVECPKNCVRIKAAALVYFSGLSKNVGGTFCSGAVQVHHLLSSQNRVAVRRNFVVYINRNASCLRLH